MPAPSQALPPSQDAPTTPYVETHPSTPEEKVSVTTETLSGSPQDSFALTRSQTPPLTLQLQFLPVELPETSHLTATLLPPILLPPSRSPL